MRTEKKKEITEILGRAKWLLLTAGLLIIIAPLVLTRSSFNEIFDFSQTGQIGDTIGGITAPFMNLIGAILVFYALKAQVKANEIIQDQIDQDSIEKEIEKEGQNLNQLYSYLTDGINGFHFKTLPEENIRNLDFTTIDVEYLGGEAFYHLFSQIRCHYHGTQEELHSHQAVSELLSILKITDLLLDKIALSKSSNKDILKTLVKHNFEYKIITRIRDESPEDFELEFCDACDCYHGLPEELKQLILGIKQKLED